MLLPRKPHVLHVIDGLAAGGGERVLVELANATDKNRYRVSVCVTRSDMTLASCLSPDIPVFKLGRTKRFDLDKFRAFSEFYKDAQVDLIHTHMRYSFLFICTLQVLCMLPRVPVIFLEQNGDVEMDDHIPLVVRAGMKICSPWFVGVHGGLTNSAVRVGQPQSRAFTIPNAIDFEPYRTISPLPMENLIGRPLDRPVGIMVANIRPTKNHFLLFDALARVSDEKWTVLLAGGAVDREYLESCKVKVKELGLESRVLFLGSRMDIPCLLRSADFGLFSSKSESGPLVFLEYIAAGLPFASTSVGQIGGDLLDAGVPGFVPPGDVDALAGAIRRLTQLSTEERGQMIARSLEIASARFDIYAVLPLWYDLYEKALAEAG